MSARNKLSVTRQLKERLNQAPRAAGAKRSVTGAGVWFRPGGAGGQRRFAGAAYSEPSSPDGSVKANKYRRFSASNPAERGGNSSAKTAQLQPTLVR